MIESKYIAAGENGSPEHVFYGDSLLLLEGVITELLSRLDILRGLRVMHNERDPVDHCMARIKSANSMAAKLERRGLPVTAEAALSAVYDAAGIRVICGFIDDVYWVADALKKQTGLTVIEEKDYIENPKPNGYRSYHMIVRVPVHAPGGDREMFAEIQIRTIAMDCWASLEHQLKYKHEIPNQPMLVAELKRCADEIASTDMTLQTIRELIHNPHLRETEGADHETAAG